jgi:hypothetical protein
MRAEVKDELLQSIDRVLSPIGRIGQVETYELVISFIRKELDEPESAESPMKTALIAFSGTLVSAMLGGSKEPDPLFRSKALGLLTQIETREKLNRYLDRLPDSTINELRPLLHLLELLLPGMRKLFQESAKLLPHGRGGRPTLINTPEERAEICRRIGSLVTEAGLTIGQAQDRLAQQKGVRKRTIERIWRKRKEYAKSD